MIEVCGSPVSWDMVSGHREGRIAYTEVDLAGLEPVKVDVVHGMCSRKVTRR
jgi:hypothetical protein